MMKLWRLSALLFIAIVGVSAAQDSQGRWHRGTLDQALEEARKDKTGALVYLFASDSERCRQFEADCLDHESTASAARKWIHMKVDIADPEGVDIVTRFKVSIVPTTLLITLDGELDDAIIGALPRTEFLSQLARISRGVDTLSTLKRHIEQNPNDLAAQLDLATKLSFIGDRESYLAVLDKIRKTDPKGKTITGALLLLQDRQKEATDLLSKGQENASMLEGVYGFLAKTPHDQVKVQGFEWLSGQEANLGRGESSRKALMRAFAHVDEPNRIDFGTRVVRNFFVARSELSSTERKNAIRIAIEISKDSESSGHKAEANAVQAARALSSLACAESLRGRHNKAIELIDRAMELSGGDEELSGLAADIRANRQ